MIYVLEMGHNTAETTKNIYCAKSEGAVDYSKSKLATVVEGDPKAPFSTSTTPMSWGGRNSFTWIAPLYP